MIKEEEDESGIREWTEEDNEEMGNIVDLYYELQGVMRALRRNEFKHLVTNIKLYNADKI